MELLKRPKGSLFKQQRSETLLRFNVGTQAFVEFLLRVAKNPAVERIVNVYCDQASGIHAGRYLVNLIIFDILEKATFLGLIQTYAALGNQRLQTPNLGGRLDSCVLIPACAAPRNEYAEYRSEER